MLITSRSCCPKLKENEALRRRLHSAVIMCSSYAGVLMCQNRPLSNNMTFFNMTFSNIAGWLWTWHRRGGGRAGSGAGRWKRQRPSGNSQFLSQRFRFEFSFTVPIFKRMKISWHFGHILLPPDYVAQEDHVVALGRAAQQSHAAKRRQADHDQQVVLFANSCFIVFPLNVFVFIQERIEKEKSETDKKDEPSGGICPEGCPKGCIFSSFPHKIYRLNLTHIFQSDFHGRTPYVKKGMHWREGIGMSLVDSTCMVWIEKTW
jgi:hypothetical protein